MITTLHRRFAAIGLLTVGAVHLEQYSLAHYSAVPTIGSLFLANFVAATAFGLALVLPFGAIGRRWRTVVDVTAGVGGLAVAAGSLAALLISERTPLFGFEEHGYRLAIVVSLGADIVAIVALGTLLARIDPPTAGARLGAYARRPRRRIRPRSPTQDSR